MTQVLCEISLIFGSELLAGPDHDLRWVYLVHNETDDHSLDEIEDHPDLQTDFVPFRLLYFILFTNEKVDLGTKRNQQ